MFQINTMRRKSIVRTAADLLHPELVAGEESVASLLDSDTDTLGQGRLQLEAELATAGQLAATEVGTLESTRGVKRGRVGKLRGAVARHYDGRKADSNIADSYDMTNEVKKAYDQDKDPKLNILYPRVKLKKLTLNGKKITTTVKSVSQSPSNQKNTLNNYLIRKDVSDKNYGSKHFESDDNDVGKEMRELKSRLSWTEQKLNDEKNTCKLLSQKILILEEELCKKNVIIDGLLDSSKKGLHQHPMMNNKVNSSESSGQHSNSRIRSVDENIGIEKRETNPRTNVIGKANNLMTYIVKSSCDEDFKKQEEDTERPIKTKSSASRSNKATGISTASSSMMTWLNTSSSNQRGIKRTCDSVEDVSENDSEKEPTFKYIKLKSFSTLCAKANNIIDERI